MLFMIGSLFSFSSRPTPMISLIIKAVLQPPSYCGATGVSGACDMIQRDSLTIKYPSRHATSVLMESETHDYIARAPHFNPQWLSKSLISKTNKKCKIILSWM